MPPPPAYPKRTQALLLAHEKLAKYRIQLALPFEIECKAEEIYEKAYDANVKRLGSLRAFLTACIFVACRQTKKPMDLFTLFNYTDAAVTKTIEALWYLENFVDGAEVRQDEITVTCGPSTSKFSLVLLGKPSMEVYIAWPESSKAVVPGGFNIHSPPLREILSQHMVQLEKTQKEARCMVISEEAPKDVRQMRIEDAQRMVILDQARKEARHMVQPEETQKKAELSKEIATVQDNSDQGVEQHGVVALDDGDDEDDEENDDDGWEMIDWENEKMTLVNSNHTTKKKKVAKGKGWTGALRCGLFG